MLRRNCRGFRLPAVRAADRARVAAGQPSRFVSAARSRRRVARTSGQAQCRKPCRRPTCVARCCAAPQVLAPSGQRNRLALLPCALRFSEATPASGSISPSLRSGLPRPPIGPARCYGCLLPATEPWLVNRRSAFPSRVNRGPATRSTPARGVPNWAGHSAAWLGCRQGESPHAPSPPLLRRAHNRAA